MVLDIYFDSKLLTTLSFEVIVFSNDSNIVEGNSVLTEHNPLCHAEINVMNKATQIMGRRLKDCVLYSSLEPCILCASAAIEHGIKEVVFGAYDYGNGFMSSGKLNRFPISAKGGVLGAECRHILPDKLKEHVSKEELISRKQLDRKKIAEGLSSRLEEAIHNGNEEEEKWIKLLGYQLDIDLLESTF